MQTILNIFKSTITQNCTSENSDDLIAKVVFELSYKKLVRIKNEEQKQQIVKHLYEIFLQGLSFCEKNTQINILHVIDGIMKAVSFDMETQLYENIYKQEQLQKQIQTQTENIQNTIALTFDSLESITQDENFQNALKDAKLRGLRMLGILKEVVEEALLTTIEKGDDIQELSTNLIKNLVYEATASTNDFTKQRFLQVVKVVLDVAVDIAQADPSHSVDIIRGSVLGSKEGVLKSVEVFKNRLKFSPYEFLSECDLLEVKKELNEIDDDFIELLKQYSKNKEQISAKVIDKMLKKELDNTIAKIRRVTAEAKEEINERIEQLKINASIKLEKIKQNASLKAHELKQNQIKQEAKKLGERAWEVAKEFAKNAKDVINKK